MKPLLISLAILTSSGAQAGQPISVSMAECAGIMLAGADLVKTPHRKDLMINAGAHWAVAADTHAGRDMSDVVEEKADIWRAKGVAMAFSSDFRDWTDYCGSLARHLKLDFVPKG